MSIPTSLLTRVVAGSSYSTTKRYPREKHVRTQVHTVTAVRIPHGRRQQRLEEWERDGEERWERWSNGAAPPAPPEHRSPSLRSWRPWSPWNQGMDLRTPSPPPHSHLKPFFFFPSSSPSPFFFSSSQCLEN